MTARTSMHSSQVASEISADRQSAEKNALYVLATLHGEQESEDIDNPLHELNRRTWHGFLFGTEDTEERERLAKFNNLDPDEFLPLTYEEKLTLSAELEDRGIDPETLNCLNGKLDLSQLTFHKPFYTQKFMFPHDVTFREAVFEQTCDFSEATFLGKSNFQQAEFSAGCLFARVLFLGDANFISCKSDEAANFPLAVFRARANMERSTFTGSVDFQQADFDRGVFFSECTFTERVAFLEVTFRQSVSFRDSFFERPVNFRAARFETFYPDLEGAVLHANSMFSANREHWPSQPKNRPSEGKNSCAVIRHTLSSQSRVDDAHFFFRQEMWFAERIGDKLSALPVVLYRVLSDYGFSIMRPVIGLVTTATLGWLVFLYAFAWEKVVDGGDRDGWDAIGLSISSTFPFFGFNRLYFSSDYYTGLHPFLLFLTASQTVAGVVFLFFLGLALRNRFRLK